MGMFDVVEIDRLRCYALLIYGWWVNATTLSGSDGHERPSLQNGGAHNCISDHLLQRGVFIPLVANETTTPFL